MCTNGINTTQFEQLIDQIDDYVALQVRHTHKLAHAADNAGYENCHLKLHAASDMLAEVRNLLDEAKFALEDDVNNISDVDVHAVEVAEPDALRSREARVLQYSSTRRLPAPCASEPAF